jgi:protein ImuA
VPDSQSALAALKRRIARLDGGQGHRVSGAFATGHEELDAALGDGFMRGRLHELFGAETEDHASASAFALMLALRAALDDTEPQKAGKGNAAPLLWLRTDEAEKRGGVPYGPGLLDLGIDPAGLLLAVMPDEATLLRAAADALRCPALPAVVIECWGNPRVLDLTASRRLTLAAEGTGVTALVLRLDAQPAPSAAETRWRIASAPSVALPGNAPGHSAFDISLLRRRAGPDGLAWRLEWNRDRQCFIDRAGREALPGAVVPVPAAGPAADRAA